MSVTPLTPIPLPPDGLDDGPWISEDGLGLVVRELPGRPSRSAPVVPRDLSATPDRELWSLSNQLYRVLDTDNAPFGALEDYEAVIEELDERAAHAAQRVEAERVREKFRDNPVTSRFELFHDGVMVGYVKYDLRAGRLRLLETIVGTDHQGSGLEAVLVREALLDAHRRRLAPIPYCRHAQAFLAGNPHFRALIPLG
ncbi:GNAT family N-acetyltransferase [uncultured Arthrobacter sp.]|uniref:GNAT family N-acetyltransferase n=1 Tax=uncultured Arthrobacter sp. TaxID=114050 RepID=UPI00260B576C|nr:N-acetyltransferase [uncultured Arthrobacter sp.]